MGWELWEFVIGHGVIELSVIMISGGTGLMIGSEFEADGKYKNAKPLVKNIIHAAEERGLLLLSCGTYDSTVRWIPPLNVTEGQVNDALNIFAEALEETL